MKAVVLAGGRERGFTPLAPQWPKALLPIANVPLLAHTLRYLAREGIRDVVVALNESARSVRERFRDGQPWGIFLQYATERVPLGTAGCLRDLQNLLGDETFVVVASLPFLDFSLAKLMATHRERLATITVSLTDTQLPGFAEKVVVAEDGVVEQIVSPYDQSEGTPIRTLGVYVVEPRIFRFIGRESFLDLKEQLIPKIRQAGCSVVATRVHGVGMRLDTLASYLHFSRRFLSDGVMGWSGDRPEEFIRLGTGVSVASSADLHGPVLLGDRSVIKARGRVEGPAAIGPACTIETDGVVVDSVLMEEAHVSEGARLQRCVVAPGCRVPRGKAFADQLLMRLDSRSRRAVVAVPFETRSNLFSPTVAQPGGAPTGDRRYRRAVKRALDLCVGALCLTVAAPVLAAAAVAIKLDSPGSVLFRQRRAGRGGLEFTMVKLRTMVADAEKLQESLADRNEVDGPMFKIGSDPRMTRAGRFLRRTRLDELPQLFNVVRGEMSLVGPRPLAMNEMQYNPAWRDLRLSVKPGITGLWQVEGSRKNTFQDWIAADIRYVEQQSLRLDLQILAKTAHEVWRTLCTR